MHEMSKMAKGVRERIEAVDQFVKAAKDKLEHTSALFQVMVDGFTRLATYVIEKKITKKKKKDSDE
jgi:general stress protein CsbA